MVLGGAGSGHAKRSYVNKLDRMEGGILRWELFVRFSSFALGPKFVPQLSRSSLQLGHFKHNMQRMHMHFC